jgi:hypothetical protein
MPPSAQLRRGHDRQALALQPSLIAGLPLLQPRPEMAQAACSNTKHRGIAISRPLTGHTEVGGVATGTNCSSTPQHYPNQPVAHHLDWSIQPLK